tara:strand:+ start:17 stop:940 length:924 start_codon:yes stop_codon:yes gene_type:complete
MKKKLLIIGGSGLLAINWAYIVRNDFRVVLGLHNRIISMDGVEAERISIDSTEHLQSDFNRINPDIVVNAAAITSVESCEENFKQAKAINTYAASSIATICEKLNIKLVHISSDHIFSGEEKFSFEDTLPVPLNNYAMTKYKAEIEVNNNNPSSLIIRTNFFGWGTDYRHSFSDFILNNLRNNHQVNLFSDIFYTPILIDELVIIVHELLDQNNCGIFNVVGDERLSKYDFGLKVADCFGLRPSLINSITYQEQSNSVLRPRDMSLSNLKLLQILGRKVPNLNIQLATLKKQEKFRELRINKMKKTL